MLLFNHKEDGMKPSITDWIIAIATVISTIVSVVAFICQNA